MASARSLLLVRHCSSSGPRPDDPLSEAGFAEADALADFLSDRGIDAVVSSAYRRAQQSIEPFAARARLTVHVDPRLNERTLFSGPAGAWRSADNWREVVRDSFDNPGLRAPGGETPREVLRRAWAVLNELLDGGYRLPVAATHGQLMALVLSSLDPGFGFSGWESLSNPDVYLLHDAGDGRMAFERLWA